MGFRPQSRPNFRSADKIPLSQSSPMTKHIFEHPHQPGNHRRNDKLIRMNVGQTEAIAKAVPGLKDIVLVVTS
jgi:hypothetical protein